MEGQVPAGDRGQGRRRPATVTGTDDRAAAEDRRLPTDPPTGHRKEQTMQAPEPERRSAMADGSWMAWTAAGIAGIWVAVALISVFAPDMVSGSEQQHLPVAAFGSWLWGLAATGAFVWAMGKLRGSAARRPIWIGLTAVTLAVWLVATIVSIALPVVETGSDPTRLPVGAMVFTALAGITAGVFARPPESG